jgi:hypothetical protein
MQTAPEFVEIKRQIMALIREESLRTIAREEQL